MPKLISGGVPYFKLGVPVLSVDTHASLPPRIFTVVIGRRRPLYGGEIRRICHVREVIYDKQRDTP